MQRITLNRAKTQSSLKHIGSWPKMISCMQETTLKYIHSIQSKLEFQKWTEYLAYNTNQVNHSITCVLKQIIKHLLGIGESSTTIIHFNIRLHNLHNSIPTTIPWIQWYNIPTLFEQISDVWLDTMVHVHIIPFHISHFRIYNHGNIQPYHIIIRFIYD